MEFSWKFFIVLLIPNFANAWPFFPQRRDVLDNSVDSLDGVISHLSHLAEKAFGLPSAATGAKVAEWHEGLDVNPEELGEYAEGDILFPQGLARNGLKAESSRWPGGVVPYMISPYFSRFLIQSFYIIRKFFYYLIFRAPT